MTLSVSSSLVAPPITNRCVTWFSFELGIPASTEVNPMTAVAEGAALFAESIEWRSENRGRKSNRGRLASPGALDLTFNYTARTPETRAKIVVQVSGEVMPGAEFQVDSLDTGWMSGRLPLKDGAAVDVSLSKSRESAFKVFAFDSAGGLLALEQDKIVITRTAATVDAIPASHSIGIEVLEKLGGSPTIEWLVRAGDQLPKKGTRIFKAGESLKAGSPGSLNFKLLEGESDEPSDNRFIGLLKITGNDFDDGVILRRRRPSVRLRDARFREHRIGSFRREYWGDVPFRKELLLSPGGTD